MNAISYSLRRTFARIEKNMAPLITVRARRRLHQTLLNAELKVMHLEYQNEELRLDNYRLKRCKMRMEWLEAAGDFAARYSDKDGKKYWADAKATREDSFIPDSKK